MPASYEILPPGGHEAFATDIFSKIAGLVSGYLPLTGGTLTGALRVTNGGVISDAGVSVNDTTFTINVNDADITKSDNDVSADNYRYYRWLDCNGKYSGYIGSLIRTNGEIRTMLNARNYKTASTYVDNLLELKVAKDGTRSVSVSDGAIWRTAIGAAESGHTHSYLPLAGGTMTGKITFNNVTNAIAYTGTKATYDMIKFKDNTNDVNGNGIVIGGGGLVVVGGGESASSVAATYSSGGDEVLDLTSDGAVNIWTNVQNGATSSDVKKFIFSYTGGLQLPGGRVSNTGDDEGIVIPIASNGYAGLCLGSPSGKRSIFYLKDSGDTPFWRYNNGSSTYDILHPKKGGTIALTSDLGSYLPLSGGTITNHLFVKSSGAKWLVPTNTAIEINTSSNNGISATSDIGGFLLRDKNDVNVGILRTEFDTSGNVYTDIAASNKKTDGTVVQNVFRVGVKKDGTKFYSFSDRLQFAKELTNQGVASPGYVVGLTTSWATFGYTTIAQLRTTISNGLLKVKYKTVSINKAAGNKASLTAPTESGWTFVCWLGCATNGWVGSTYIRAMDASSTEVWNSSVNQSGTGDVVCYALYRAS